MVQQRPTSQMPVDDLSTRTAAADSRQTSPQGRAPAESVGDDMTWTPWAVVLLSVLFVAGMPLIIWRAVRTQDRPRPMIDRSHAYAAKVIATYDTSWSESAEANVKVEYVDAEGVTQQTHLADVIDRSWLDRFTPGSTWQIYPYYPATTRVVLTEAHDDVWRCGYNLDGVHIGGQSGPVDVGPGSPFPYRPRGSTA